MKGNKMKSQENGRKLNDLKGTCKGHEKKCKILKGNERTGKQNQKQ